MGTFETIEAGGVTSRLYAAGDLGPGAPGVVVFHPWWGLNDDVVAYADRVAAAGFAVVAPDLYCGAVASTIEGPSLTRASVPVLGHFAETDPYEPDGAIATFGDTLRSAGRDVVIQRYPGTGHWFAEPSREAYHAAALDLAFERTMAFLGRHLGTPRGWPRRLTGEGPAAVLTRERMAG